MKPDQIKKIRGSLGLDQTQFALLVGVKRATISAWENGHPPRPRNITKLMELLNKKWVGLTDEEVDDIGCDFATLGGDIDAKDWFAFYLAIEARLKEKNT